MREPGEDKRTIGFMTADRQICEKPDIIAVPRSFQRSDQHLLLEKGAAKKNHDVASFRKPGCEPRISPQGQDIQVEMLD